MTESKHYENHRWIKDVLLKLTEGDEVFINDRNRPLVFEGTEEHPMADAIYVELSGYGTTYRAYVPTRDDLKDKSLYLKTKSGSETRVKKLRVGDGGGFILSDVSAEDFIGPTVADPDTLSSALDGLGEDRGADGDELGECPDCGETVVEADGKATCTECPLWCPADEWRAYTSDLTEEGDS